MKNTTSGFTLIELLIVIAIIGILATALIPNLIKAREAAFNSAAQSCAKQINTAQEMYFVEESEYAATLAALDQGAVKGCLDTKLAVVPSATGAGTDTAGYSYTVTHAQGSKTYTVDNDGIEEAAKTTTPATGE